MAERKETIYEILLGEGINDKQILNAILNLKKKSAQTNFNNHYENKYQIKVNMPYNGMPVF